MHTSIITIFPIAHSIIINNEYIPKISRTIQVIVIFTKVLEN